ncbi:hypothetical protein [Hyalangium minutum]|uniref:Uncharacterized protein n=1 Tax=Hyalangium minutum TaxID=394096 RepID=A0A085WMG0_9BACT|nr:hypothetical protein [Hyalangium minutum]KFE68873.1 hypothetical protein DB31_6775 [Hyalangium minutum]
MNEKTAQESQKTESPKAETPAKKAVIVKTRIKAGPGGGGLVHPIAN